MKLNVEVTTKTYLRAIQQMAEMAKPLPNSQAMSEKFPGISLSFLYTPPRLYMHRNMIT